MFRWDFSGADKQQFQGFSGQMETHPASFNGKKNVPTILGSLGGKWVGRPPRSGGGAGPIVLSSAPGAVPV